MSRLSPLPKPENTNDLIGQIQGTIIALDGVRKQRGQLAYAQSVIRPDSLDPQVGQKWFEHTTTRCGVNLPRPEWSALRGARNLPVSVSSERLMEQIDCLRLSLFDLDPGLIDRSTSIPLNAHRVGVPVNPDVSVGIDDAGHVCHISLHTLERTPCL